MACIGVSPLVAALPTRAEKALAPEKNPPGDIPDSQVFITYENAVGYALKVPEGWARSEAGAGVRFQDKLDAVSVTLSQQALPPTMSLAKTVFVPELEKAGRAVQVGKVSEVTLPAGHAIRIDYSANSDPNPVTTKQIRLEANRYLIFRAGRLATLDLSAPYGADNVDQWQLMAQSFRWR
ncbi:MAG: hypothetical protein GC186_15215 [Rhodobacteraceae bacterium]|nr:hypothetical protein [Paracoccaceae bacterium]